MASQSTDKPKFASLNSGLLARKGSARPAMRRPSADAPHGNDDASTDLGWNDLGLDAGKTPAPAAIARALAAGGSEVLRQQNDIARKLADDIEQGESQTDSSPLADRDVPALPQSDRDRAIEPQDTVYLDPAEVEAVIRPVIRDLAIKSRKTGKETKDNAAFTLRLDADRHLRLRLACAVQNVSAQRLVTEALDELLDSMPELEALAQRVASK